MPKEHLFANWQHCYPVVFVCRTANTLPRLLIDSSLDSRFLIRNSTAMQFFLSHRCLLNGIEKPQSSPRTTKIISPWPRWDAERTSYWPHLWEFCHLSSTCPTIDCLLLCIRSLACSDPKMIVSDQKQHLLGLSEKVKAVVFQFSPERGFTGAFRTHLYNLMRAAAKSISLCQNR